MKWLKKTAEEIAREMECEKCGGELKVSEELSEESNVVFSCAICGNTEYSYGVISETEKMEFAKQLFGIVESHTGAKTYICN